MWQGVDDSSLSLSVVVEDYDMLKNDFMVCIPILCSLKTHFNLLAVHHYRVA